MKKRNYSENIAHAISSFLTEDDWRFYFDDQLGVFRFNLSIRGRIKKLHYIINVREDEYVVYTVSPLGADDEDEKMMATMADFFCRVNYGLRNGNFEFDMRDGEIRYKSFVDCEGITPTAEMVRNSIYCPAAMFKRYGSGIVDIIMGNASAREAVYRCEKSPAEGIRELLSDGLGEDEDVDAVVAQIAARLGINVDEFCGGSESSGSDDGEAEVRTDLFGTEGEDG